MPELWEGNHRRFDSLQIMFNRNHDRAEGRSWAYRPKCGPRSEAQKKRAATQQINALAQHAWKPSNQPSWLTATFYSEKIQPALLSVRGPLIARVLKVSNSYARDIRKGQVTPHPRHWGLLASLVGYPSIS